MADCFKFLKFRRAPRHIIFADETDVTNGRCNIRRESWIVSPDQLGPLARHAASVLPRPSRALQRRSSEVGGRAAAVLRRRVAAARRGCKCRRPDGRAHAAGRDNPDTANRNGWGVSRPGDPLAGGKTSFKMKTTTMPATARPIIWSQDAYGQISGQHLHAPSGRVRLL